MKSNRKLYLSLALFIGTLALCLFTTNFVSVHKAEKGNTYSAYASSAPLELADENGGDLPGGEENPNDEEDPEDPSTEEPLNILFIGNSFTKYNGRSVEEQFELIASTQNKNVNVTTIAYGSSRLSYYVFPSLKYSEYYKAFYTALFSKEWDYIVLQEQSLGSLNSPKTGMYESVAEMQRVINIYQPDAKILLYATHAYNKTATATILGNEVVLDEENFQTYVQASYSYLGQKLDLPVVQAGLAFYRYHTANPDDTIFLSDNKHPNNLGYFIIATAFYKEIFGELPYYDELSLFDSPLIYDDVKKVNDAVNGDIKLNTYYKLIAEGQTLKLMPTLTDSNETIIYSSSKKKIATVDETGTITGVNSGYALITAETESGIKATCVICVEPENIYKKKILFSEAEYIVYPNDKFTVIPTTSNSVDTENIQWTNSSGKSVAQVGDDGVVTAKSPGKAVIKATDPTSSKYNTFSVYVKLDVTSKITAKTVTATGTTQMAHIKLSWSGVSGATGYIIYRATSKNGNYIQVGTASGKTFTDKTAIPGTKNYYKIATTNSYPQCTSEKSTVYVYVIAPAKPTIASSKVVKKQVTLKWKKVSSATGYILYKSTNNGKSYKILYKTTSNKKLKYIDKKLKYNKKYCYKIKSYREMNGTTYYSNFSDVVIIKPQKPVEAEEITP